MTAQEELADSSAGGDLFGRPFLGLDSRFRFPHFGTIKKPRITSSV